MSPEPPESSLQAAITRAARLLPAQGPLGVFIHHNPLHHLEHLPFDEAVQEAHRLLGAEPYPAEEHLRALLAAGEIAHEALRAEHLAFEAAHPDSNLTIVAGIRLREIRWRVLTCGLNEETPQHRRFRRRSGIENPVVLRAPPMARLRFVDSLRRSLVSPLARGDLDAAGRILAGSREAAERLLKRELGLPLVPEVILRALRLQPEAVGLMALRARCAAKLGTLQPPPRPLLTHREQLLAASGLDVAAQVNAAIVPLLAGFIDEGQARWEMPGRQEGLLAAALALLAAPGAAVSADLAAPSWRAALRRRVAASRGLAGAALLAELLAELGVEEGERDAYLEAILHELPGWAAMIRWREMRPGGSPASLAEYLALRLLLTAAALEAAAPAVLGQELPLAALRAALPGAAPGPLIDPEAQIAESLYLAGVGPAEADDIPAEALGALWAALQGFDGLIRRRLLHRAWERTGESRLLGALSAAARRASRPSGTLGRQTDPEVQVLTCLDEREEGLRRALEEELGERAETFGVPGFFGLPIRYRGLGEAGASARCPAGVEPTYLVEELPTPGAPEGWAGRRRALGWLAEAGLRESRALVGGALLSLLLGPAALLWVVLRCFLPGAAQRGADALERWLAPAPPTRLQAQTLEGAFSPEDAAQRVAVLLSNIGLTDGFAPLVLVLGHGSTSRNNAHASAYNCGACGGEPGGANARLFAALANDPRVREILAVRGIAIPPQALFVGGWHDTCTDEIHLWRPRPLPAPVEAALRRASARHAQERVRRFLPPGAALSPAAALAHVRERAASLAQPRPEYGHATNALCVVGRRGLTRGLFLDRRAFLVSYNPERDPEGLVLGRILEAVTPVCAGINLEYYFSTVDNRRLGAGTKLPFNPVGLVGVLSGCEGDLRTGLPLQTVEIHEARRLMLVVEASPARLAAALARQPHLAQLADNGWIHLFALAPGAAGSPGVVHARQGGAFVPLPLPASKLPAAASSADWAAGWSEHLGPAWIGDPP